MRRALPRLFPRDFTERHRVSHLRILLLGATQAMQPLVMSETPAQPLKGRAPRPVRRSSCGVQVGISSCSQAARYHRPQSPVHVFLNAHARHHRAGRTAARHPRRQLVQRRVGEQRFRGGSCAASGRLHSDRHLLHAVRGELGPPHATAGAEGRKRHMELMSGNEAIAQGAWEAGCTIGVAYPGTPSTETLEAFAKKEGVYAEWCVNEKVAVEVGIGASAAGARVLATMKHVGVNVAPTRCSRPPTPAWAAVWSSWQPTTRACTPPRTSRTRTTTPRPPPSRVPRSGRLRRGRASRERPTSCPSASTCRCSSAPRCACRTRRRPSRWGARRGAGEAL